MILVTGDVVLDHNIYEGGRLTPDAPSGNGSRYLPIPGGAMLTYGLLNALVPGNVRFGLAQTDVAQLSSWPEQFHTRALWHPVASGDKPKDGKHWGLERHLGYGNLSPENQVYPGTPAAELKSVLPEILILDDGGLGFRESEVCWPECLTKAERPPQVEWAILKMSRPLARGKLWLNLMRESWRERLIVIVSADQLRGEGLRVAGGLSWETTVDDIVKELDSNRTLRPLKSCRHLIVTMRSDAALWLERPRGTAPAQGHLVFDRTRCEGEWEEQNRDWKAYGFFSTVTASVAWSVATGIQQKKAGSDKTPVDHVDLTIALASGLSGTRFLRKQGHGPAKGKPSFPFQEAAKHLQKEAERNDKKKQGGKPKEDREEPEYPYASAQVDQAHGSGKWTILSGVSPWHTLRKKVSYEPGRRVALLGPDKLPGVPCARFQKLQTLDRNEIDGLRSLRQLMLMYRDGGSRKQPLCLAVFGAPGSGKSFGLKQIAAGVFGEKNPILEFNLSQFADTQDLIGAYHQARDKVLSGATPVVFWDEFDSKKFEWLQYFLAPMQDGAFQEGQLTHFIGKSIFVFAGGTSSTYEHFKKPEKKDGDDFKLKKGPDFVSRIAGYLNIAGPNPREVIAGSLPDREFPVRRAILIRGILELGDRPLEIERGLLTALLAVPKYCNGARSLDKLVSFIKDRGGFPLRRAYLPPDDILALYVEDVEAFHELTRKYAAFYAQADLLAGEIHRDWLANLPKAEWTTNANAKRWDGLPQGIKESNVAAALRIPEILEFAGLGLEEGSQTAHSVKSVIARKLELMAEAEHGGWEEQKRIVGWTCSPYRLDAALRHDLLVPYERLKKETQKKDKDAIGKYITNARQVGFKIISLPKAK